MDFDEKTNNGNGDVDNQAVELAKLKVENEELLNNWKRTAADFENYKKRKEQEAGELLELAKEAAVFKLMPSLQSLEQVLAYAPEDERFKDWLVGLSATIRQLEKAMEELGVKKIPTVGSAFDHNLHEAVGEAAGPAGQIMEEVQPGFTLNDKVISPAKVVVGNSKA